MMVNISSCSTCIHQKVCSYISSHEQMVKEVLSLSGRTPHIFRINADCLQYDKNEQTRSEMKRSINSLYGKYIDTSATPEEMAAFDAQKNREAAAILQANRDLEAAINAERKPHDQST